MTERWRMGIITGPLIQAVVAFQLMTCTTTSQDPSKATPRTRRKYAIEPKAGSKTPDLTPTGVISALPVPAATLTPAGATLAPLPAVTPPPPATVIPPLPTPPALSPAAEARPTAAATTAPNCLAWPGGVASGTPVYFQDKNIVVTRLLTECRLADGSNGFDRNTQWMAMGIPCTGGGGKLDWTDKYVAPKQVAFQISNNCPMVPQDAAAVASIAKPLLGLGDGAKLLGYTSFIPQFWEIVGQPETDIGYAVELRTPQSLGALWTKVREGQPLKVKLYGRENAWLQGDFLYEVGAEIVVTDRNRFKLVLENVKPMSEAETAAVKQRCEALKPKRNCGAAF